MYRFKNYIAYLLLLLFVRVLAPETVVLQLHPHEHTEEEQQRNDADFKLSKKHTHCHTDDLFNAPFAPALTTQLKAILIPFTDSYSAHYTSVWKFTFPNNIDLRGPPQA